ncbi:MAG: DUF1592 domain-containing protein [Verrucomicrobiota bacterium]
MLAKPDMQINSKLSSKLIVLATLIACPLGFAAAELTPDLEGFDRNVKPLLQKYCTNCHGEEKQKASLRFDRIDPDVVTGEHFDKWEDLREAFNNGEMPPEDEPQPTDSERQLMTEWMDAEFKKVKQYGLTAKRGSVRRLTRYELRYALEDLLQYSVEDEVNTLPEEGTSLETGLKNNSRLLMISSPHLEAYLNVILSIIDEMKEIAVFEPVSVNADIENLDVNPPETFAYENKKNKPPVANVTRAGKGVVIAQNGYIDLKIPSVSKCRFDTSILAKADGPCTVEVTIGFQHSEFDPRQVVVPLGVIQVEPSDELQTYSLSSFPDILTDEFTRGDRPFFIRITNKTRGEKNLYLERFDYLGNVNTDLTETLVPHDLGASKTDEYVRQEIATFLTKAFRRPAMAAELQKYEAIYEQRVEKEAPSVALLSVYKDILCSPDFFYLGLPGDANYKLAEKLAFFLWCSVPDQQLLDAAAEGNVLSQVDRMLKDERARRWVENFTDQWLQTSQLGNVAVDGQYYPKFRDTIKELMHQETYEAVNDVFRNGAQALDLLKADHVFVNQALAGYYGLKGVRGDEFRKVSVDPNARRGGLLTQGTFLIGNSDGMNSHAILRGVWLAETILHDPPPDPPANVPPLDESIPGFDKMTLNEKLFAHRNKEACRSCHQQIDPWGIPFENYDASGKWREKVLVVSKAAAEPQKGKKKQKPVFEKSFVEIEREATLPDGVTVDGMEKLKEYLVDQRRHDFAEGLVERILAYALSRDVGFHDEDLVSELVDHFEESDYSVPALIREIAASSAF